MFDENTILMNKSMFEKYQKYKCCVFIDFEYSKNSHIDQNIKMIILISEIFLPYFDDPLLGIQKNSFFLHK